MKRRFTERSANANVKKSTVSMALANHETPFDVGVDAAFSETSLHKVPMKDVKRHSRHPASTQWEMPAAARWTF